MKNLLLLIARLHHEGTSVSERQGNSVWGDTAPPTAGPAAPRAREHQWLRGVLVTLEMALAHCQMLPLSLRTPGELGETSRLVTQQDLHLQPS